MAEEIKRMNFFDGLFLTQKEFNLEQEYHLRMRHRHNRFFHGCGVIDGLEVKSEGDKKIKITSGAALSKEIVDGEEIGREIILLKDSTGIDLSGYGESSDIWVYISYFEEKADIDSDKGGGTEIHWWEKTKIEHSTTQPVDTEKEIVLAKVTINSGGDISISNSDRKYAGFDGKYVNTDKLEVSGDAHVGGTLNVLGQTSLKSTDISGDGNITNNLVIGGKLDVSGDTALEATSIAGDAAIKSNLDVDGTLSVNGESKLKNTTIAGGATVSSKLDVGGGATVKGNLAVEGQTELKSTKIDGKLSINDAVDVGSDTKVGGNLTVEGNLVVNGDTTSVNAATLEVEDNIITANRFKPKTKLNPHKFSGLEVFRGKSGPNAQLVFDEADDQWKVGIDGSLTSIATIEHLPSGVSRDIVQKAHGLKVGQAIRYDAAANKYIPAIANNEATTGMFIVSTVMDADNFSLVQAGFVEGLSGLMAGEYYYVSDKVAGELTNVEPLRISNPIFFAETESSGYVLPFRPSETAKMLASQLWSDDGKGNIHYDKGNVGIGTVAPKEKLEVSGNIDYSGTLNKLNVKDHFVADVGCGDFRIGHSSRKGSLGRALVDLTDTLVVNYGKDWKNTRIDGNVGIGAALHVAGELLGAARDEAGNALKVYCGKTLPGKTAWAQYSPDGIRVDVDISGCGFKSPPTCIVNMHGLSSHWTTTGGSEPYSITNLGFSIYVRYSGGGALTPAEANKFQWHIQWIAIGV